MGCCSSVSNNEVSGPQHQNPPNLQGPLPASGFRSMVRPPPQSPQQEPSNPRHIKKSSSRIHDFQQGNSSPQQKKFVLTEEEERVERSLEHKNRGNTYFKNRNYVYASQEYTRAIEIYNKDSIYYSNRAQCFRFLGQFDKVIIDAEMSIKLAPNNYKGFHLKGIALLELGKHDIASYDRINQGIKSLHHSFGIVMQHADREIIQEISAKIGKARKLKWLKEKEQSEQKKHSTHAFLNSLISKDQSIGDAEKYEKLALLQEFADEKRNSQASEVPETLCCKITFEMIQTPALSPSGVSYENDTLIEHLRRTGDFDPCTRQQIRASDLIKNKTLANAIHHFQQENPWCFDSGTPNDDYRTITFN